MTVDQFKAALPDKVKKSVNQELIDKITKTLSEPDMYETYRENLISYAGVMADGKFKISNYIDAIKYVSFKLAGKTNIGAFSMTFPDKMQDWAVRGVDPKDQASYMTAYNKSKLVMLIMEQSLVPTWVLNQDNYQKAINVQVELMLGANSEKVRSDAANSLLTHLKQPETQKVELNIGVKQDSVIDSLRQATEALVAQQKQSMQAGSMNAQEVAHSNIIIEGELENEN